jgi:hypothetical protein
MANFNDFLFRHSFCFVPVALDMRAHRFQELKMLAKLCWLSLTGISLVSGVAASHGLCKPAEGKNERQPKSVQLENRPELQSVAAQRYINSQARHWRALVVNK